MIFFYLIYATAWILMLIAPDTIVFGADTPDPITMKYVCVCFIIGATYGWLRMYRWHPVIGFIYRTLNMIIIALLAVILWYGFKDQIKKEVKEWFG